MIKVLVVDDEPEIGQILKRMIEKQDGFTVTAVAVSFSGALSSFNEDRPDVVLMDIDLKGESGLSCAKIMCELSPKVKIIFATAHSEYMANAFEIYAFDYLVKPFNMERLHKTLERIKQLAEPEKKATEATFSMKDKLVVKNREQMHFVDKNDIIYIERVNGACEIHTAANVLTTSASLGSIEAQLDSQAFIRSHKSYIISLKHIASLESYGRWTYCVHFKGIKDIALLTEKKYEELKALM